MEHRVEDCEHRCEERERLARLLDLPLAEHPERLLEPNDIACVRHRGPPAAVGEPTNQLVQDIHSGQHGHLFRTGAVVGGTRTESRQESFVPHHAAILVRARPARIGAHPATTTTGFPRIESVARPIPVPP